MTNPYQPPNDDSQPIDPKAEIRKRISRPATALLVMAAIHSVFPAITIVSCVFALLNGQSLAGIVGYASWSIIHFALLVTISIGAAKLGHLESYRFGRFAALCSCIPGVSPFTILGIPFAVWALRLLADPEVRGAYPDAPAA